MRCKTLLLDRRQEPLCHTAWIAEHAHQRLRGLLFRPSLQLGQGLLLVNVRSVHTMGMRYPLDIVFLSADLTVVSLLARLPAFRIALGSDLARHTLELPSGSIERHALKPGERMSLRRHVLTGSFSVEQRCTWLGEQPG